MRPDVTFEIRPMLTGYAVVEQPSGRIHLEGEDVRSLREVQRAVEQIAKERGLTLETITAKDGQILRFEGYYPVDYNLSMGREIDQALTKVASDLGISKAKAIARAIALLQIASEAKRQGKAFGVADSPDSLSQEIVGL